MIISQWSAMPLSTASAQVRVSIRHTSPNRVPPLSTWLKDEQTKDRHSACSRTGVSTRQSLGGGPCSVLLTNSAITPTALPGSRTDLLPEKAQNGQGNRLDVLDHEVHGHGLVSRVSDDSVRSRVDRVDARYPLVDEVVGARGTDRRDPASKPAT